MKQSFGSFEFSTEKPSRRPVGGPCDEAWWDHVATLGVAQADRASDGTSALALDDALDSFFTPAPGGFPGLSAIVPGVPADSTYASASTPSARSSDSADASDSAHGSCSASASDSTDGGFGSTVGLGSVCACDSTEVAGSGCASDSTDGCHSVDVFGRVVEEGRVPGRGGGLPGSGEDRSRAAGSGDDMARRAGSAAGCGGPGGGSAAGSWSGCRWWVSGSPGGACRRGR